MIPTEMKQDLCSMSYLCFQSLHLELSDILGNNENPVSLHAVHEVRSFSQRPTVLSVCW